MKFFIDSVDITEIKEAVALGLCDGVTTNTQLPATTRISDIIEVVDGPISLGVTARDYEGMMAQARELREHGDQIVVQLPIIRAGLKACRTCFDEGIATDLIFCFSAAHALVAARAGATYVSPQVGGLNDMSLDGMELVEDIMRIYDTYDLETQVLVRSLDHPRHIVDFALTGAHAVALPISVMTQLVDRGLPELGPQAVEH